jgi:ABC-type sulfate/molybdate transport systems ATPase subunit
VVVGAANSGKTTLLRCAAGLLAPDEGAVDRTPGADGQILLPTYLTDPIELARLQSTGERWELALVDNVDRVRGDVDAAFAVLAAARQVHASGAALLLAARDAASVSNVADRIVYIDRGRLRPPASVCQTPGAARVAETNVRSR